MWRGMTAAGRLGVACTPDRLVAVRLARGLAQPRVAGSAARALEPPANGAWPSLSRALAAVADELGAGRTRVSLALAPPLAATKTLALPAVRRHDLRLLLGRTVRRHFLVGTEPVIVDGERVGPRAGGGLVPTLTVCADAWLVARIESAIREAKLEVETITSTVVASGAAGPSPVAGDDPLWAAAYGAVLTPESAPALISEGTAAARTRRARGRAIGLGGLAVASLATAGVTYCWGLRRELAEVRAQRTVLTADVARAQERTLGEGLVAARARTLADVARDAFDWSEGLAALAAALPRSAYLISVTTDGARVRIGGVARSAAVVVPALEASSWFREVALSSTGRSPTGAGEERFEAQLLVEPQTRRGAPRDRADRRGP